MKKYMFAVLLLLAVIISGCTTPYDGSPPKVAQERTDAVKASAVAWLSGSQGSELFQTGSIGDPIPVFDSNRTFEHWVIPVKNSEGLYLGFFTTKKDQFTVPELGATKYPDPRRNLFTKTKSEAYSMMLEKSAYSADNVKEPYVSTIEGKGYQWTSEVVVDGRHVERMVVPISIIEPSEIDKKGPGI